MKLNITKIIYHGIQIEYCTTPSTAYPSSHGIGGAMITSWVRFAGIMTWQHESWGKIDIHDTVATFTNRFYLVQWLQSYFKLPFCINPR